MGTGGVALPKKTKNASPLTNPVQAVLAMASKELEYAFPFPKETKFFEVRLRKHGILRWSYLEDELISGTIFSHSGNYFGMDGLQLTDDLIVYFRSFHDGDILEIHYWT